MVVNKNLNIKDLIIITFIILLAIFLRDYKNETDRIDELNISYQAENNIVKENDTVSEEEKLLDEIKSKSEYERMQYYFAQYITYIENKDYEKAYSLLYPEFKDTYFPTLETYTEYVKKLYPKFVSFEYENFTRQGYVYILTVKIIDPVNGSKEDTKTQRIILKENNFYDYVLSFQVI